MSNTTGTGGILQAIPLIAKGAAEAEGTTQDENFLLVIDDATDVLAADFEECDSADTPADCPTGGTQASTTPSWASRRIVMNTWYHAAVTFDGNKWQLFLNGNAGERAGGRSPAPLGQRLAGRTGHFLTTDGTAQGFFDGTLDEVRIWNYARTQAEIHSTMNAQIGDTNDRAGGALVAGRRLGDSGQWLCRHDHQRQHLPASDRGYRLELDRDAPFNATRSRRPSHRCAA